MSVHSLRPFHLAFTVNNIEETRDFYVQMFGCEVGRSSDTWIDFNFYGHQVVGHVSHEPEAARSDVDGKQVPVRHFGIILERDDWDALATKLKVENANFIIEPYVRFEGLTGEQATMFITDPSGNGIEFKAFKSDHMIFEVA